MNLNDFSNKLDRFITSKKGKKFELYLEIINWLGGNFIGWVTILLIYLTTIAISGRLHQQTNVNTTVSNYYTIGIIAGWLMQTVLTFGMASLNRQWLKKIKELKKEVKELGKLDLEGEKNDCRTTHAGSEEKN